MSIYKQDLFRYAKTKSTIIFYIVTVLIAWVSTSLLTSGIYTQSQFDLIYSKIMSENYFQYIVIGLMIVILAINSPIILKEDVDDGNIIMLVSTIENRKIIIFQKLFAFITHHLIMAIVSYALFTTILAYKIDSIMPFTYAIRSSIVMLFSITLIIIIFGIIFMYLSLMLTTNKLLAISIIVSMLMVFSPLIIRMLLVTIPSDGITEEAFIEYNDKISIYSMVRYIDIPAHFISIFEGVIDKPIYSYARYTEVFIWDHSNGESISSYQINEIKAYFSLPWLLGIYSIITGLITYDMIKMFNKKDFK